MKIPQTATATANKRMDKRRSFERGGGAGSGSEQLSCH